MEEERGGGEGVKGCVIGSVCQIEYSAATDAARGGQIGWA